MTTLAKQLSAIAANSSHQLDLKAQRLAHAKSLIFDAKTAVSQSFDTLFQICFEAWEELCLLDPRFKVYASNLFSDQSKALDRGQITAAQNEDLDRVLQSFLRLVSCRLLLKPAQKAVEWLIRRFHVHQDNTEALLLAFLPYYSTPLFVSLVALMTPKNIPRSFRFLLPYQASNTNPPNHALIYSASHHPPFFTAFNSHVIQLCREGAQSSFILTFWSAITSQAIDAMLTDAQSGIASVRSEKLGNVLLRVLPVINDALAIKSAPDITVCACLFVTILSARGQLPDHVSEKLMEAMVSQSQWSSTTADPRIVCLAVLAQNTHSNKIPRSVFKKLLAVDHLVQRLIVISQSYDIDHLLLSLLTRAVDRFVKDPEKRSIQLIQATLESPIVSRHVRQGLAKKFISEVTAYIKPKSSQPSPEKDTTRQALVTLYEVMSASQFSTLIASVAQKKGLDLGQIGSALQCNMLGTGQILLQDPTSAALTTTVQTLDVQEPVSLANISESAKRDISTSFLESFVSDSFTELCTVFCAVASSPTTLREFMQLPLFQYASLATPFTFLLRVASSNVSLKPRVTAISQLTEIVSSASNASTDHHTLIPFILRFLADPDISIRRAASNLLSAVSQKFDGPMLPQPWTMSLYQSLPDNANGTLSALDAKLLIKTVLLPRLEECVMDQAVVLKTLHAALSKQASHRSKADSLSSASRSAITRFLAVHATKTCLLSVRLTLLSIVSSTGKSGSDIRSETVFPAVLEWSRLELSEAEKACQVQGVDLSVVTQSHFQSVTSRDTTAVLQLGEIANDSRIRLDAVQAAFERLGHIWRDLSSPLTRQQILISLYRQTSTTKGDAVPAVTNMTQKCLKSLPLFTDDLVILIDQLPKAVKMPEGPSAKRRRASKNENLKFEAAPQAMLDALNMYTLALELVEQSSQTEHVVLLEKLFHLLSEVQSFALQTGTDLEYLKILAVNNLLLIVQKLKDHDHKQVDQSSIRMDLLVDTIRGTSNAQLQNSALLLISCLAGWMPDAVLYNVMPIFTFMGSSILRQGDDYSAHVIEQTVSSVIPPVVSSLRKRSKDVVAGISDLLLSFTAAFQHIPNHRRLALFKKVVDVIGADECLSAIIIMMIDRLSTDRGALQFLLDLMGSYDTVTNLSALAQCAELILDMLGTRRTRSEALMQLKDMSPEDIRSKADMLMLALSNILSSSMLRSKFAQSLNNEDELVEKQQLRFSQLLSSAIRLTQSVKSSESNEASMHLLSNTLTVLPMVDSIESAKLLLQQDNNDICRVVINGIARQVNNVKTHNSSAALALLEFETHLTTLIESPQATDLVKLECISAIQLITNKFGKKDSSVTFAAAQIITNKALASDSRGIVKASLTALTSMLVALKDEMVPLTPRILQVCYEMLLDQSADESSAPSVACCFELLTAMCRNVGFVMSGNKLDKALQLEQASSSLAATSQLMEALYEAIAANISSSEVFAALNRNFDEAKGQQNARGLSRLFQLAKSALDGASKKEVLASVPTLFDFFCKAFGLRWLAKYRSEDMQVSYNEAVELEAQVVEVAMTMVMKINDATLRPLFLRLMEQSTTSATTEDGGKLTRQVTLFHFLRVLVKRLRALVTGYTSYVLELISEILMTPHLQDDSQVMLVSEVVKTLSLCFEFDEDGYWQAPSHFDAVSDPLVVQLEGLASQGEDEVLQEVTNALTQLCLTGPSADQLKTVNSKLLKLMVTGGSVVRLAAIRCEQSLTQELGEDWLGLLPEMLPIIAELLEDDNEEVEGETRKWIRQIEDKLGESLDSMLQ